MATYNNYVMARTLEEAYALNQKQSSVIVAGNMWLRMCGMRRQTAIDLSLLGLDAIEEAEDAFLIGAMTPLRALETHEGLNRETGGAYASALSPIVGTQFRNTATIGGSVYSRFGFSDVSALLLSMGAQVVLYHRGAVPMDIYQREAWDRDIITHIRVPKGVRAGVASVRLSKTDIPTLVCAAAGTDEGVRLVIGARPARAVVAAEGVAPGAPLSAFERIADSVAFGGNLRAGAEYRRKIAPVLMQRAARACLVGMEGTGDDH